MTPEEHHAEADRLLHSGRNLLACSQDPDAAGSAIRKRWAKDARDLFAEAAVHAAFVAGVVKHGETE